MAGVAITGSKPSDVVRLRRDLICDVLKDHGVSNPRVFGSVARGTDTERSDLDLLVSVPRGAGLSSLSLAENLTAQLGIPVDVVSDQGLHGVYRKILDEAVPL